jgi:hypothetical protein
MAGVTVLKPARNKLAVRPWRGATVHRITPVAAAADIRVELNGASIARPASTVLRPAPVTPAGGAR